MTELNPNNILKRSFGSSSEYEGNHTSSLRSLSGVHNTGCETHHYNNFIASDNQTLLWKTINQSVLFNQIPPNERADWFKNIVGYIYFERNNNFGDMDDLLALNKKTIQFMLNELKSKIEPREKGGILYSSERPEGAHKNSHSIPTSPSSPIPTEYKVNPTSSFQSLSGFFNNSYLTDVPKAYSYSPDIPNEKLQNKTEADTRYKSESVMKKELSEKNAMMFDMKRREFDDLIANNTPPQIDFRIKEIDEPIEDMESLIEKCIKERNITTSSLRSLSEI